MLPFVGIDCLHFFLHLKMFASLFVANSYKERKAALPIK